MGAELAPYISPAAVVTNLGEAVLFAAQWGSVAIKAEGSVIAHRTEVGAVRVGLDAERSAHFAAAYEGVRAVCDQLGDRVVVQQMAPDGLEVMVSVVRDRELGPVPVLTPGGVLVELGAERVVLTGPDAIWHRILAESPVLGRLLAGFRGGPVLDADAVLHLCGVLRDAMQRDESLDLVECNPIIVQEKGKGVSIVDIMTVVQT